MAHEITVGAVVERKGEYPNLPRFVVVPSEAVAPWKLAGTTTVEGTINSSELGRRSVKFWDGERWFIELPEAVCKRAGVDTGDRVELQIRIASEELPDELRGLIEQNAGARKAWQSLSAGSQRMLREEVLALKQPATRIRRARRALGLD